MSTRLPYIYGLCVFIAAAVLLPYSYEETRNISAEGISLQGCNASITKNIDALYLNPANISGYSNLIVQASTKSPFVGFNPSVTGAFGIGIPISKGEFGIALAGDYFWDTMQYTEFAARFGFGWNMQKLLPGISFGATIGVNGFLMNYSELGGLYAYTTNAFTFTFGCSLGFTITPGIKGSIAIDNIQFLGVLNTILPPMLRAAPALPTLLTLSQSFTVAPDHTLMLGVGYYFPTDEGDLYEITLGYTWAVLPYLLDLNISGKSINVIKSGSISLGFVFYPVIGIAISAGWLVNINTPNPLGDIYASTVFHF